jgi:ribose 5-phosphate isomerase B
VYKEFNAQIEGRRMKMIIAVGSDHAGVHLKTLVVEHLKTSSVDCKDFGVNSEDSVDYPDIASAVTEAVQSQQCELGILICGTGIGMSIAANKRKGIRAALCAEPYSARCAREHNDANILTMGSRVIGPGLAAEIVATFLTAEFAGGRHSRRLEKITYLESNQ